MAGAAVDAITYADLFDWPLSAAEVHRFLPVLARPAEVVGALETCVSSGLVSTAGGLYVLPGREGLVARRREREATSARLWTRAARACRVLAALPWIRLVAVSGSLAVGAADEDADVDLFIVTVDGRLWLARALTILVGRALARPDDGGDAWLCPNYMVTTSALALPERDEFTAHELAQLVPLHGLETYRALLAANTWYRDYLPNHPGHTAPVSALRRRPVGRAVEPLAHDRLFARLERWERDRKIARLALRGSSSEVRFDATTCKGHYGEHRRRTMQALRSRTRIEAATT